MGAKGRLFIVLLAAGLAGVLSFLLVDLEQLIRVIPVPEGEAAPELPPWLLLKVASVIQPALLTTAAAAVGVWLAGKVGLRAPAAEAFAERRAIWPALRPQIVPGVVAGILSGIAIVALWLIAKPFLPEVFLARAVEFNNLLPAATRFLYGGLTEEILLRWGVMTLLVFVLWKVFRGEPRGAYFVASIFISALLFGMGHLPIAFVLGGGLTMPMVIYVVAANSLFGIVAGFLYWRIGLEAAMIAHIFVHVVLLAAMNRV